MFFKMGYVTVSYKSEDIYDRGTNDHYP